MWVFTPFGFVSVVAHRDREGFLVVRGRVEADVRAFRDRVSHRLHQKDECSDVVSTPGADYPFRFECSRRMLSWALAQFVEEDLDYDNFKNEVARVQGRARAHAYCDVWGVMRELEAPRPTPEHPVVTGHTQAIASTAASTLSDARRRRSVRR